MSRVSTAYGGPVGWLLILLSISVLTVTFERLRFWWTWWKRRSIHQQQWRETLRLGGDHPLLWLEDRDLEMRFAEPLLEAAIVIAPLLGLIGTVLGLSRLLAAMGPQLILPSGSNLSGFSEVLMSTAMGLLISLLATVTLHVNNGLRHWRLSVWRRDLRRQFLAPVSE